MGKSVSGRRIILLCLLLAVQIGLVVFMFRPEEKASLGLGPLLRDFKVEQVTGVTITDEQGPSISLVKVADNWVIGPVTAGRPALPADGEKLATLLTKLSGLQRDRLVTRTPASHSRLKVGQLFARRLTLATAQGDTTILLGSAPNYKNIHVRLEPENEVYLAQNLSTLEAPVERSAWWRADYVKVDPATLTALTLHNPRGSVNLSKDATGAWRLAGQPADRQPAAEALPPFLADLCTLTILQYHEETARPTWDKPLATLTLTTAKESITLEVGPKDKAKDEYPVKSSASPLVATAAPFAVKDILGHQVGDLLRARTSPRPAPAPAR